MKISNKLSYGILLFFLISIFVTINPVYADLQIYFKPVDWHVDDVIDFYMIDTLHKVQYPHQIVWDFGDGKSSVGKNVSHQYDNPGKYKVKLTATLENGNEVNIDKSIRIDRTSESFDFSLSPVQDSFSSGQSTAADIHYVNKHKKDTPISFTCIPPIPHKTTCTVYPAKTSHSEQDLKVLIATFDTISSGQYPFKIISEGQGIQKCKVFTADITNESLFTSTIPTKNSSPINLELLLESTKNLNPTEKCDDSFKEIYMEIPYSNYTFESLYTDKLDYDIPKNSKLPIYISGNILEDKYVKNAKTVIIIKDPLGNKHRIPTDVVSPGMFGITWTVDKTFPIGIYEVHAKYGNSYSEKTVFLLTYDGDSVPSSRTIQYNVYLDIPEKNKSIYQTAILNSFQYWEEHIPVIRFNSVSLAHESDFYIQWASEYEKGKLGYVGIDNIDEYYAAITTGNFFYNNIWVTLDQRDLEKIATHEIGHMLGMRHVSDSNNVMHNTINLNDNEDLKYSFLTQNEIVQPSKFVALVTNDRLAFKIVELLQDPFLDDEVKTNILENLPSQIYNELRNYVD